MTPIDFIIAHARKGDTKGLQKYAMRDKARTKRIMSVVLCALQNTPARNKEDDRERRKVISTLQQVVSKRKEN